MAVAEALASSITTEQLHQSVPLESSQLSYPLLKRGKVRDLYRCGNLVAMVSCDRQSAFDQQLATVPLKGWALTMQSAWWFSRCQDIIGHHLLEVVAGRVMLVRPCRVFPVEVVVRGFLTGSTSTSIWRQYSQGHRCFAGLQLADGLKKNSRLPRPIITPTTKDDAHDQPLTAAQVVARGLVPAERWAQIEECALALFRRGQQLAAQAGLLLVDTKYEFGLDPQGRLVLVDELHSGDSSRFCLADSAEEWPAEAHFDKEFLRAWVSARCDPYRQPLPPIPPTVVWQQAQRYLALYERLSGDRLTTQWSQQQQAEQQLNRQLGLALRQRGEDG